MKLSPKFPRWQPPPVDPDLAALLRRAKDYERERIERDRLEEEAPRFVIVMVHGTFARKARWIERDSPFGEALRDALAPAKIVPFRWSGGNGVKARAKAVLDLQSQAVEIRQKYPDAHHAFVAHSHGGNVVLNALADEGLAEKTLGVVTLGTPFLDARTRDQKALLDETDGFMAAVFAGITVFAIGAALGLGRAWWLPGLLTFVAIGVVLMAGGFIAGLMRKHAERICRLMPKTRLRQEQLAIVRTASDEAAAALSGARVAGGFASLFWTVVSGPVVRLLRAALERVDYLGMRAIQRRFDRSHTEHLERLLKAESPIGYQDFPVLSPKPFQPTTAKSTSAIVRESLTYLPILILSMLDDRNASMRWLGAMIAIVSGLPAILALLVNVVSVPFSVLFALGLLPCGLTLPLAGPFLDLTVEPAPPGTWSVTQLRPGGEGRLSHGRAHDDRQVFDFAGDWLKQRAALTETAMKNP